MRMWLYVCVKQQAVSASVSLNILKVKYSKPLDINEMAVRCARRMNITNNIAIIVYNAHNRDRMQQR